MSAPKDSASVCNLALDLLGQPPVADIENPTSTPEKICARWYDHTRRALLREYVWNFAKKRTTVSRSGTPAFDFADAYTKPLDCLRILSVGGEIETLQEGDYDIEGSDILVNYGGANSMSLRYIADITDPSKWDSLFLNLMTLRLALNLAYKFSLKKGLVEELDARFTRDLPKSVSVDGQERPPRRIQRSRYLTARRRGESSGVASQYTIFED